VTRDPAILIGIDVGTTSTRVVAFDLSGRTLAAATHGYAMATPRPDWAEQNPEDWWEATRQGLRDVAAAIDPARVAGLSFSGQMHGSVFLDREDRVIRPALLWCDGRTAAEGAEALRIVGRRRFLSTIKNPPLPSFTLPKLLWLRRHEPRHWRRLACVLLPKDYVRFRLTGRKAMDVADAAGTAMMEVGAARWAEPLLKRLAIDPALLPPLLPSTAQAGRLTAEAARATGLREGTPVVAGAGDQPAGAVGVGVFRQGQCMISLGTSGVIFAPTRRAVADPTLALATFDHAVPRVSYLMGCMLSAGGALQWHRNVSCGDEMAAARQGGFEAYDLMLVRASRVEPGAEGLFFLPYLMGERSPHNDPKARGAFVGLSIRHERPHLTRAVIEGVSFGLRDCLEAVRARGVGVTEVRATGGGARNPFWMQTLADVLGVRVRCVESPEGSALGAALMAGVGVGVYNSFNAAAEAAVRLGPMFRPSAGARRTYEALYAGFRALYPALRPHFHRA